MTPAEFESILAKMDDQQFIAFQKEYGGDIDRSRYVQEYVRNQAQIEPILCRILKFPTEDERAGAVAEATMRAEQEQALSAFRANQIAEQANLLSHRANKIALWACIVAAFALAISVVAIIVAVNKP